MMNENKIYWAKLRESAIIPSKRQEDGGMDVYANFEQDYIIIKPFETKLIPTGIASAFSSKYVAILKERGSTGTKGIGQRCGVIDSGFRGEWFVPLTNHNNYPIVIAKKHVSEKDYCEELTGSKELTTKHIIYPYEKAICQAVMQEVPVLESEVISVEELISFKSERMFGKIGDSNK